MDYVYDIEFYKNFFCVNLKSFPDGETKITFEISSRKDERTELIEFIKQKELRLIGYNNVGYDYPVLHYLLESPEISLLIWWKKVQRDIFNSDKRSFIWDNQRHVFQIDLFKINHYDNMARSCSLKWLEFTKRWYKVQDLPIDPQRALYGHEMDLLIEYCWNDVDFTFELGVDCWNAVKFRERMSEMMGRNLMDYSDVKIGEFLNQRKYEELSGKTWKDIKDGRTYRKNYPMKDIIPSVIEFKSIFMQEFLEDLRGRVFIDGDIKFKFDIVMTSSKFDRVVEGGMTNKQIRTEWDMGNTIITFAKGGLHTVDMPRVVNRKEGWVLMEKDVASMYPRSIVVDGIYPKHLGIEWNTSIAEAYEYRNNVLKPQLKELEYHSEEWNKVNDEQEVYKLAMNGGGFGKLGSSYSWQFDPLGKYRVTMGCELKLLMLIEDYFINGIQIVSVNTDGVVIHFPKEKQALVDEIHRRWEEKTSFVLENTHYNKLVYSSVNDYIAVIVDEVTDEVKNVKYKGDFEINKDPHKNNSQRIIAIALSEYFTRDNINLSAIVQDVGYKFINTDGESETATIYDFCIGRKKTSSCEFYVVEKGKAKLLEDKVIRFYIANTQNQLLKKYTKGKRMGGFEKVSAGFNISLFMEYYPFLKNGHYQIDKNYYLNECRKIIEPIESGTRLLEGGAWIQGELF